METKMTSSENEIILDVKKISKRFGGTRALKEVDFAVRRGEVHALIGENGAGKSTLMNIIMGLIKADEGEILFEGEPYHVSGPSVAIRHGISMIHQELNVEPFLTVAENIFLKREHTYGRLPFLNQSRTNNEAKKILKNFSLDINPKVAMSTLTVAQAQMIEIIKAVSYNSRLIIMDEPTSSLDSEETVRLMDTIKSLKAQGVSIIYISHRLEEIFDICDVASVFRDGQYIATKDMKGVTKDELISLMVGHKLDQLFPKTDVEIGDVVFRVEDFNGDKFRDISFEVREGEILGFSGLVGAGRSETMCAIFGLDKKSTGRVFYKDKELKITSPKKAIEYGMAMVSEDRKNYGLVLKRSIKENIALPNLDLFTHGLILDHKAERKSVKAISKQLSVKAAGLEVPAYSLSGGNQQKVVLSKWLMSNPKVLILDEPTRGIDVGAKSEIHRLMSKLAGEGMAIILVSSELPEVMGMSDRILVFSEGRISGEVHRKDILSGAVTEEGVLGLAFGQKLENGGKK